MRRILRASGLMGTASAATIASGVVRAKILALLVGAQGIGLFGLFQSFQGLAAAVATLGVPGSGIREVALANAAGRSEHLLALKRVLLWLPLATGALAALICWLARRRIAVGLFDDPARADDVGILGVGVAALTVSLCQTAWINGLRRIGRLARLRILGALGGALLTILLVAPFGLSAIAWAVAATSVLAVALSTREWLSLSPGEEPAEAPPYRPAVVGLVRLGAPLMIAGLLAPITHLAVRARVLRVLGDDALGHWQAAWSLSMIYIGFVLAAMATDYLPRLSERAGDRSEMVRLINEQSRVALLLVCPVVLAMLAAAPLVVRLLYSGDFDPAVTILGWQLLGDFFKVPAWALVTVFAALGRGGGHLAAEAAWNLPYLGLVWFGVEPWGLPFCGIAFFVAYALYFTGLSLSMRRLLGFRWSPGTLGLLLSGLAAAAVIRWLAALGPLGAAGQAVIVAAFALFSLHRIRRELKAE